MNEADKAQSNKYSKGYMERIVKQAGDTLATMEEDEFVKNARTFLSEEFPEHYHPINKDPLLRAQPCHGFMATHRLEFDPGTKTYNPVPKIPQHERGD